MVVVVGYLWFYCPNIKSLDLDFGLDNRKVLSLEDFYKLSTKQNFRHRTSNSREIPELDIVR